jgi:DHA2 family multidrug resistance protein
LQTGPVLLWVALPQLFCGILAIYLLKYIDARLILTAGFSLIAIACLMNANLSSAWSGSNFLAPQLVLAIGFALSFNGVVGAIVLDLLNAGALSRPIDVLTFAGYIQTVRIFGGQLGSAFLQHFISAREQYHSNILGLGVQIGLAPTDQRLMGFGAGTAAYGGGAQAAAGKAVGILSLQLRQQAFTLGITDAFVLVAWSTVCCLIVIACMARVPTQYHQIISPPVTSA